MSAAVAFRDYAWLCSAGLADDSRFRIEDLLFDSEDLCSKKTDGDITVCTVYARK